jgi:hypothetical protein
MMRLVITMTITYNNILIQICVLTLKRTFPECKTQ